MVDDRVVAWLVAGVLGQSLGVFFYGGLWWTVQRSLRSPRPGLWFVASLALRTAVVLGGFYLVGDAQPQRLLICLLGFSTVRLLVVWRGRRAVARPVALRVSTRE